MKVNIFISSVIIFIFLIVGCKKTATIETLQDEIDQLKKITSQLNDNINTINSNLDEFAISTNKNIETQTALFYRVLGESLPVNVPAESELELKKIIDYIDGCIRSESPEQYKQVFSRYLDFVTKTPPWVQEELYSTIKDIKYSLEFLRIIITYKTDEDFYDACIKELTIFSYIATDYSQIDLVKTRLNTYSQKRLEKINSTIQNYEIKVKSILNNYALTDAEYEIYLTDLSKFAEYLASYGRFKDSKRMFELTDNIKNAKINFEHKIEYDNYKKEFAEFSENAQNGVFSLEKYNSLRNTFPIIKNNYPGERDNDDEILYELNTLCTIKNKLADIEAKISHLSYNEAEETFDMLEQYLTNIEIIENQVYSIKLTKIIKIDSVKTEIEKLKQNIKVRINKKLDAEKTEKSSDSDDMGMNIDMVNKGRMSISTVKVTNKQFASVMKTEIGNLPPNLPIVHVSYYEALQFCNNLSLMHNLDPVYTRNGSSDILNETTPININANANGYRLPSMAQLNFAVDNNLIHDKDDNIGEMCIGGNEFIDAYLLKNSSNGSSWSGYSKFQDCGFRVVRVVEN